MVILCSRELNLSSIKGFKSSSKFDLLGISESCKFRGLLLSLEQIIVKRFKSCLIILALSLPHCNCISKSIDLILVGSSFISESCELISKIICILSESICLIRLDSDLSLKSNALLLPSGNLISN